ncbi:MAG: phosphatidylglycerophosphatase A [Deltaproteobacteria bacterium]|nr:phosphatidylglycerophosphatase A [Deltaproteobacteria bacterium]
MLKKFLILAFATGFGSGYSPIAPGTAGSAVAFALYYLLTLFSGFTFEVAAAATSLVILVSFPAAHAAGKIFCNHDDGRIVIDEFAGFFTAALFFHPADLTHLVYIFFVFRFFDVAKPFPIGWIDRNVRNGFGCVMDDVLAGVYTALAIIIVERIIL